MELKLKPMKSLSLIDPCEFCQRDKERCHSCSFLEEHFRVVELRLHRKVKDYYLSLQTKDETDFIHHAHSKPMHYAEIPGNAERLEQAAKLLLKEYEELHPYVKGDYVPHSHGVNGFDSCFECDEEIENGKWVELEYDGYRTIEHVCNSCYISNKYRDRINQCEIIKVMNY